MFNLCELKRKECAVIFLIGKFYLAILQHNCDTRALFFKAWQDYLGFQECKCILKSLINYNMWRHLAWSRQTPGKVNFGFSRLNINFHNRLQSVLWPKNFPMTRKIMFHSYFLYPCNFIRYESLTIFICELITP